MSERLASQGRMGAQLRSPQNPSNKIVLLCRVRFRKCPELGPNMMQRDTSLSDSCTLDDHDIHFSLQSIIAEFYISDIFKPGNHKIY